MIAISIIFNKLELNFLFADMIRVFLFEFQLKVSMSQFDNAALLLVDFQQRWTLSDNIRFAFPNLQDNVNKLTTFCRSKNMEIVHIYVDIDAKEFKWCQYVLKQLQSTDESIYHLHKNKPDLNYSNPSQFNEKVIIKRTFGAFVKTDLDKYLKSKNISSVYVSGLITSVCVLNTLMGAIDNGYDAYIVEDCCGDNSRFIHDAVLTSYREIWKCVKISNGLKRTPAMICKL